MFKWFKKNKNNVEGTQEVPDNKVEDIKNILEDIKKTSISDKENLDKLVEIENILNDINHET